jgi:hypothetical protein
MDKNFDWKTYINNYEDLRNAGINTQEKAWRHWIMYGKQEGRSFNMINTNKTINYEKMYDCLIDTTYKNNDSNIKNKLLLIISCHSNSKFKYNVLKNNIAYLTLNNIDIIIINSIEFKHKYKYNISPNIVKTFFIENDKLCDFGKWVHVIKNYDYSKYKNVVFVNDSIILTNNINNYFINIDNTEYDLYGFNDSKQITYHYQSYIFSVKKSAISDFIKMVDGNKNFIKKFDDLIKYYEFGLYRSFMTKSCYITVSYLTNGRNLQFTADDIYSTLLITNIFPIIKVKRLDEPYIPQFIKNALVNIDKIHKIL